MRNIADILYAAEQKEREANAEVVRLRKQMEFEQSFGDYAEAYMVIRRCIDTGRITEIMAIFEDQREATRFANGQPGYGLDKDIFIEPKPLYYMKAD